jgi:hypothetical protein
MSKRLQVILGDPEYREIQRVARSRHMSIAEWSGKRLALLVAENHDQTLAKSLKLSVLQRFTPR